MTALEASIVCQPNNLRFYVLKLMRLRGAIFVSGFKRAKPLRKFLTILLGMLFLGAFAGCFILSTSFIKLLDSPIIIESGVDMGAFMDAIPTLIVSGAFLAILVTSFGVLLQALYLANDMDFLMSAPIPIRAVFLTKLLQAILPNFILVVLIGLPVLFSLGKEGEYHALYYPLALVVLAFLSLAAAGISSLLVMVIVRIIPAKRVAEVLAFLGVVVVMLLSQWSNLTGIELGSVSIEHIVKGSQALSTLNDAWQPMAWGGRGLVDLGEGRWLSGTFFLALTVGLFGGIFWLTLNIAERLYYSGWASLQVETQRNNPHRATDRRRMNNAGTSIFRGLLPPEMRAVMLKDFKALSRDLRIMSQMVGPLVMGIVFTVMVLRSGGDPPAGKGEAPALFMDLFRSVLAYGSMVISLFVGWTLLSRLALISFSMEGKSYWIIKTSPISARKLLAAKFLITYLPVLLLTWLFLLSIALLQKVPFATICYGLPCVAFILAGLGGINLAFGVRGVNLNWTDPRRMASGIAGYLGTIASIVYLFATLLLFFAPPLGLPLINKSEGSGQLIGLVAGGMTALLCAIIPLVLVKDRVYRIGEE
jgi:ABC-2 type transport system permease protein